MKPYLLKRRDAIAGGFAGGMALVGVGAVAQETSAGRSSPNARTIDESKAKRGNGVLEWHIDGPQLVIGQPVCPFFPEYFYQVIIDRQEQAEIRYLIWNKIAPPGTGAIERVCVNDEGDYADGKTPTYVDFPTLTVNMSFCSFGDFTLEAIVIWQDTGTKANHLQRKSITITSKQQSEDANKKSE